MTRLLMFLAAIALLAACAQAEAPAGRAIDGDTLVIAGERIRLLGVDAPEMRGRCRAEREQARAARDFVAERLSATRSVAIVDRAGRDRWGRSLARVTLDGADLGQALLAAGLARPYDPKKGRQSWC